MEDAALRAFATATELVGADLRRILRGVDMSRRRQTEEIRLRAGRPLTIRLPGGECPVLRDGVPVTVRGADLETALEYATRASLHAAMEGLRQGYITAGDGHRVGICGTAAVENGQIRTFRTISSLTIRVAREYPGISRPYADALCPDGRPCSALIVSPPGHGKTTFLRDLIRELSLRHFCVGVADERGEIAAMSRGVPRFDVGPHTDVMEGAPREQAAVLLLRTMRPDVVALDEITAPEDASAVHLAANCGVAVLATVHGSDFSDACCRLPWLPDCFSRVVEISCCPDGSRRYRVVSMEGRS